MNFDEIDLRRIPAAIDELIKLGVMATPALLVGDKVVVGFDPAAYDKAIEAQGGN